MLNLTAESRCLKSRRLLSCCALGVLAFTGGTAFAAPAAPAKTPTDAQPTDSQSAIVPDIVVTAQKRSETVQKIPLAVTALSAQSLRQRGETSIADFAQAVPALNVTQVFGAARIQLRGIGLDTSSTGAEGGVAINVDGVYFSRSGAALAGFYDIDRVEVLRGPQGTLYGRNATAGSVNIITKQPTDHLDGYLQSTVGNYGTANAEGAISGPLTDTLSVRLSFQTQHHDGFGKNLDTGHDIDNLNSQAARVQLLWKPTTRLSVTLSADWFHERDNSNIYHNFGPASETSVGVIQTPISFKFGGFVPANMHDIASAVDPQARSLFYGGRLDVKYSLSDTVTLRSLSAYRRSEIGAYGETSSALGQKVNGVPFLISLSQQHEYSNEYTQETQLNWETDRNKFVGGLYYLHENVQGVTANGLNTVIPALGGAPAPGVFKVGVPLEGTLITDAAAAYAQDTFSITPDFHLTAGGRYSWERKGVSDFTENDFTDNYVFNSYFNPNVPIPPGAFIRNAHSIFKSFTPKFGLDYQLSRNTLVYASYSKGFKSGNYNLGTTTQPDSVTGVTEVAPAVKPEKVTAYEAGLKTTLLDGRFRANITGFYYDYTDIQVREGTAPPRYSLILVNAGKAAIYGAEGEFTLRPLDDRNFALTLNTSWLHARYTDFLSADPNRPGQGDFINPANGGLVFNLKGAHLPQAPDYKINLGAEYALQTGIGTFTIRGDATWTDRVFFTPFNIGNDSPDTFSQAPTAILNAGISYDSHKLFYANFNIKNLTNKSYITSGLASSTLLGGNFIGYVAPPRTFALTVGVRM